MKVLITGHTGFKGAWLSLMLAQRGHEVSGLALDPVPGGLYESARLAELMAHDFRVDIRDASETASAVAEADAEVIFHMAAQPLVRESYADPRGTIETNVNGTMNVLDAVAGTTNARALVVVTTDKVYRNVSQLEGYVEDDSLGGDDPYSASKSMADILTQSWVKSFGKVPTSIARAGNVIGGGDASKDRLIVDLVHGFANDHPVAIRYPEAVRPWQHVLDCLSGYLSLAGAMLDGGGGGAWNFGPDPGSFQTVRQIADASVAMWGEGARWIDDSGDHPHEAQLLTLDSRKAQSQLAWRNALAFPISLQWTIDWYRAAADNADARSLTLAQIANFCALPEPAGWQRHF